MVWSYLGVYQICLSICLSVNMLFYWLIWLTHTSKVLLVRANELGKLAGIRSS